MDKIKRGAKNEQFTIVYLLVIVGVGLSAFGLGRLSVNEATTEGTGSTGLSEQVLSNEVSGGNLKAQSLNDTAVKETGEKNYVASKNGKLYYTRGCSGAKRIKPENEVWFATTSDAEKSGFAPSSSCH